MGRKGMLRLFCSGKFSQTAFSVAAKSKGSRPFYPWTNVVTTEKTGQSNFNCFNAGVLSKLI